MQYHEDTRSRAWRRSSRRVLDPVDPSEAPSSAGARAVVVIGCGLVASCAAYGAYELITAALSAPYIALPAGLFFAVLFAVGVREERRLRRERERDLDRREGSTICEFARDFPRRSVDPWVVRAIWDLARSHARRPIRAEDWIEVEVFDHECFDDDLWALLPSIRRDPDVVESSEAPLAWTFGDLVRLLSCVPRTDGLTWARPHA